VLPVVIVIMSAPIDRSGGVMFLGCPSVRVCVCMCMRPSGGIPNQVAVEL